MCVWAIVLLSSSSGLPAIRNAFFSCASAAGSGQLERAREGVPPRAKYFGVNDGGKDVTGTSNKFSNRSIIGLSNRSWRLVVGQVGLVLRTSHFTLAEVTLHTVSPLPAEFDRDKGSPEK